MIKNIFNLKSRHKRILSLIKGYKVHLVLAMFCMVVVGLTTAAVGFLVKPILDDIFLNQDQYMLKLMFVAVIAIYFFRGAASFANSYLMNFVGQDFIRRIRVELYNRVIELPLSFFQHEKTGGLMSIVSNDVRVLKAMVTSAVTGFLRDIFTIVCLLFVIFYRDWLLAIVAITIFSLAIYPIQAIGRKVRRVKKQCQECIADFNCNLQETFHGNKIVKAFCMESHENQKFYKNSRRLFRFEMKVVKAKSLSSPIMEILGGAGIGLVIFLGGYQVVSGQSTPGGFFSFMTSALMLYEPVKRLSNLNAIVQSGLAAADRIFDVLERESEVEEIENPLELAPGPRAVSFQNVCFKYGDEMILKNINIQTRPGEILAIVGLSGAGKTSLINLIPRFYDVTRGEILIDGIDVRELSLSSLRDQIAIVTQDPILFSDSVRNNIAYGNEAAADIDIIEASKTAYAYEFINALPEGFDTDIGEFGNRLSGGEKQRICIARALLKDAPILILDEATAALDAEAEMMVQKALKNLIHGRTTFIVAHRLSTISFAKKIIVLEHGEIVEEGSHEELMERKMKYYKLVQMQLGKR